MYTATINVGRRRERVRFTGMADGGSYYRTSDEDIQKALEGSSSFGVDYILYSTPQPDQDVDQGSLVEDPVDGPESGAGQGENITPEKEGAGDVLKNEQPKTVEILEDVTTITGAREVLRAKGVDYRKLNSPKSVLRQAAENNVEFPNLIIE